MFKFLAGPFVAVLIAWGLQASQAPAHAQGASTVDGATFEKIISDQIEAFRADDSTAAFSFAAPVIREKFSNAETFMQMVKRGYAPVYRPRDFSFGEISDRLGYPTQHVRIIGPDGSYWIALYAMQKQPDESWRISGVTLLKPQGESA